MNVDRMENQLVANPGPSSSNVTVPQLMPSPLSFTRHLILCPLEHRNPNPHPQTAEYESIGGAAHAYRGPLVWGVGCECGREEQERAAKEEQEHAAKEEQERAAQEVHQEEHAANEQEERAAEEEQEARAAKEEQERAAKEVKVKDQLKLEQQERALPENLTKRA